MEDVSREQKMLGLISHNRELGFFFSPNGGFWTGQEYDPSYFFPQTERFFFFHHAHRR